MGKLNKETIKSLTRLSRIDCTEEEQESLLKDLEKILVYIDLLHEVDTEGVVPCNQILADMTCAMRDDVIGETLDRTLFLDNAPAHVGGMIRVPPVIKSQS